LSSRQSDFFYNFVIFVVNVAVAITTVNAVAASAVAVIVGVNNKRGVKDSFDQ
jgi:hypothetical protein